MPLLNTADALYLGAQTVDAAYLGAAKVWPSAGPPSGQPAYVTEAINLGAVFVQDATGLAAAHGTAFASTAPTAAGRSIDGLACVRDGTWAFADWPITGQFTIVMVLSQGGNLTAFAGTLRVDPVESNSGTAQMQSRNRGGVARHRAQVGTTTNYASGPDLTTNVLDPHMVAISADTWGTSTFYQRQVTTNSWDVSSHSDNGNAGMSASQYVQVITRDIDLDQAYCGLAVFPTALDAGDLEFLRLTLPSIV